MATPFIGEIRAVGFTFPPRGWMECNGAILSIAQNTALFSLLGTTYGGNGQTTFALPDLRGRVPVGHGQGPGLSSYDLGQLAGEEQHTLLVSEMPAHGHGFKARSATATTDDPHVATFATPLLTPRLQNLYSDTTNANASGAMIAPAGAGQPHENRQPYLTVLFVIAVEGIFPPRP
jgi:microcystin-dependent protein